MIRVILLGRTGNHLFQYLVGRVVAARHDTSLCLDASWFNNEGWAEVSHFLKLPIKAKVVRRLSLGARALRKFTGKHYWEYRGVPTIKEPPRDHSFNPKFLDAPSECVLMGYFQSPLYFRKETEGFRHEINEILKNGVETDRILANRLKESNAVAMHVRRQDYLQISLFQVCGEHYYRRAMSRMKSWVPDSHFFVFSDDPQWCEATFRGDDVTIVNSGSNSKNPLHDLRLMSLASHHIIPNSTYSWWAAWLGEKPGQRVLMPDRWYTSEIMAPIEEKRLPHWTILES